MHYFPTWGAIPEMMRATAKPLQRRGFALGYVCDGGVEPPLGDEEVVRRWQQDGAAQLSGVLDIQPLQADIAQAHRLMAATLETCSVVDQLEASPYREQLGERFPLVAAVVEEHDEQGIEKLYFDVENDGGVVAEELWCKASWLSFHDDDASLRFRFSFGMEGYEDVAADPQRQQWAAQLCDAIFPESRAITTHGHLQQLLSQVLGGVPAYVERIVYFNAPNGGAQMHHDVERGHDGVVFAQMSGSTFWLALSKPKLMDEISAFVLNDAHAAAIAAVLPDADARAELMALVADRDAMAAYLEEGDHELLEAVMDRLPEFFAHLVAKGYGYFLKAGDLLLLPQKNLEQCVWHSVCNVGDQPGEALSFAVRRQPR